MMKPNSFLFLLTSVVMAISTLFNAPQVQTQSGVELENVGASHLFEEQITFVATLKSPIPIQNVAIIITDTSQGITHTEPLTVQADGRTEFRWDTRQNILRPFTPVNWNYQITLSDGSTFQSPVYSTRYTDNRFNWQTLESGTLRVNWYQGDANFGQAALNAAQAGLVSAGKLMPIDLVQPIEVYVYANADDLRGTLLPGIDDWIAGHTDPALGVVMVLIEPDAEQGIAMEQRIPHELMHVLMYRSIGRGYDNLPAWLREGTATLAEIYPNADYDRVLADAAISNDLIPLEDLCASFPADRGQAFLAYAESRSFTGYLQDMYGSAGLLNLAASYADGVDCEHGTERAFGVSLSSLEMKWRASVLGQDPFLSALKNNSAYLALLCLVLIIPFIGIVSTLRKRGGQNEPETYVRR